MTKEKMMWILMEAFEKDPRDLFSLLKKKAGKELTFAMTGLKKVESGANLPAEIIMRIQYGYCAFCLLAEENGDEFAKKWIKNGNIYLPKPIEGLRSFPPNRLFLVMNAVFNCIKAGHGIIP